MFFVVTTVELFYEYESKRPPVVYINCLIHKSWA